MSRLQLTSNVRTDFRKSETKRLRREGFIPATLYGKGEESISLAIPAEAFGEILKTRGGRLSIIDLAVEGAKKPSTVMIQVVQRNPITKGVVHIDLHQVKMDEPVHARVPVQLIGDAPGVKLGGILEHVTREIEVKALPDQVPSHIDVDVSKLELGESLHVSDLVLTEGIELIHTADAVVAMVRQPIVRTTEEAGTAAEAPSAE